MFFIIESVWNNLYTYLDKYLFIKMILNEIWNRCSKLNSATFISTNENERYIFDKTIVLE